VTGPKAGSGPAVAARERLAEQYDAWDVYCRGISNTELAEEAARILIPVVPYEVLREQVAQAFFQRRSPGDVAWSTLTANVRETWLDYADRQLRVLLPALGPELAAALPALPAQT
jgi:hypothetical protein